MTCHEYVCFYCGKGFKSKSRKQERIFCSRKCSSKYQSTIKGEKSPLYKGNERKTICPECGKADGC